MNAQRKLRYTEKLSHLQEFSQNLERWMQDYASENEVDDHAKTRFAMYHMGQLCVEAMTDLAAMMLKDLKQVPKDDYSNFKKLIELKLISRDLEKKLAETNGLRNRLAHDYNGINENIALESLGQLMGTISQFRDVVVDWLQKI